MTTEIKASLIFTIIILCAMSVNAQELLSPDYDTHKRKVDSIERVHIKNYTSQKNYIDRLVVECLYIQHPKFAGENTAERIGNMIMDLIIQISSMQRQIDSLSNKKSLFHSPYTSPHSHPIKK